MCMHGLAHWENNNFAIHSQEVINFCHSYKCVYVLDLDDIVIVLRSQHDSHHRTKADLFKKKLNEQIIGRSIKVHGMVGSDSLLMLYS